ncbi:MAG: hypothetical protein QOH89_1166, partial [Pseudonocardiales bacterium]|nr:hypothetical protein [Pseudonocardiales bacterium]
MSEVGPGVRWQIPGYVPIRALG